MTGNRKKKLPIGIEDFKEIMTEGFYYADKTGLIRELLSNWGKVNLFTRPRRFGKSLNMSMLKYFFDIEGDPEIFQGLAIAEETELCRQYMGQYPVISLSLKGVNGMDFESAYFMLCSVVGKEALRFQFLAESGRLTDRERKLYEQLVKVGGQGEELFLLKQSTLEESLHTLSMLLDKHYGQKVILLIDEYDVPLAKAFDQGYYDEMIMLIRNFLGQALKTNSSLKFAVLTGCMRISRESIFTGLNNLRVFSIMDVSFHEYFGFTDSEVKDMLGYYGLTENYPAIKDWYDGYQFGNVEAYCPWDVINYCYDLRADSGKKPQNYWSNTSGNDVVRRFIRQADTALIKREIEQLVAGESVAKEIHPELTYRDMYRSIENIWSVLFATGYLTKRGSSDGKTVSLVIPNREIREIYTEQIMAYFKEGVKENRETLNRFCEALESGNEESVEKQFQEYLRKTISIRDTFVRKHLKENFYHGILIGILGCLDGWIISSNKEAGDGYSDIVLESADGGAGIIIEVKYAHDGDLEKGCKEAVEQIAKNNYEGGLYGEEVEKVLKYGIACYKKRCKVQVV